MKTSGTTGAKGSGAACPLDKAPPDGETTARDGGEHDAVARTEEAVGESAGADAAHDGELVQNFFGDHLR